MRPKVIAALMALSMVGGLAACGGSSSDDNASGASSTNGSSAKKSDGKPLKIALIPPTSGALAVFGADAVKAWEYAAAEANAKGGVDGHKVELVKSETDGQPPTTIRAARKAATQDDAHFIGAVMTSPEHGALGQQLQSMSSIDINSLGKDDALTGSGCNANMFRSVQSNEMDVNAVAATLSQLPAKKWAIQAVDYSTGHSAAAKFTAAAKAAGKQVVMTSYAPLNTTEYGSYISKLKGADADGLFVVEYGADGVAFVNQGAQFKLFDKYKTVLGFNTVSEPLFKTLGSKVIGFYNNLGYDVSNTNALNAAFVKGFTEKEGSAPYYVEADNYIGAQLLFAAVTKAGSVDPAAVNAAMKGLTFDSIEGPVSMGADGQLVRPTHIGQVIKKADGVAGMGWKVVASAPGTQTHPKPDSACKLAAGS